VNASELTVDCQLCQSDTLSCGTVQHQLFGNTSGVSHWFMFL